MKKFYDRAHEMSRLKEIQRQAYDDCSRFVVLTGIFDFLLDDHGLEMG